MNRTSPNHSIKRTASAFKTALSVCGVIVCFIASIVVAFESRQYQISGQPMPNGKGGFMTPGDGYLIAIVLFMFSVACLLQARRCWREKLV